MTAKGSPGRVVTDDHKSRTSASLKLYYREHPEVKARLALCLNDSRKQHPEIFREAQIASGKASLNLVRKPPTSLFDLSTRTLCKILRRLEIGCSRCGWSEAAGDIHHIGGRKIPDANNHRNLTYLCPNCHRLAHSGKIKQDDLISLETQVGDRWKDFYFPEKSGMSPTE